MTKPLVLTPRAARWLHALLHQPGIGVQVPDLAAAAEAVAAVDAYVAKLPPDPDLVLGANGEADRGVARR